ncbi:GDYXXLXY domain-containing protein [Pusillimonas sp. CC-YST705]|uniref:GDYXXLXY domain-containing protein n=1 Tax=Mesopusillimonas faecipullorum TaxID=2755040 RepID=A0ABS8CDE2_9BURK|nr:GDYXXLXY domain-containing protein [Mesopusillimonas faecipullorum]MCB5364066.1 GDYXXLXY domain-containing protein [Mesopusillimonas faecipullorum]
MRTPNLHLLMPGKADLPFLRRLAIILGSGLLASAAICWIAANWPYASALQKLAGTQTVLSVSVFVAGWRLWARPHERGLSSVAANALGLAAVLVGALFALIGQTYQTGADPWQLFALWSVLIVPWAFILPTAFLLCLLATVLNLALVLFLSRETGLGWAAIAALMAVLNLALMGLREVADTRLASDDTWRIGPRVAMAALLGWWLTGLVDALNSTGLYASAFSLSGFLVGAGLVVAYTRFKPDAVMLSLLGLAASAAVSIIIIYTAGLNAGLPIVIVALVACFIYGARHLLAVVRKTDFHKQRNEEPWFISAFRLVLMGLAVVLCLLFLSLVLKLNETSTAILGVLLLVVGLLFVRTHHQRPAWRDLGVVLSAMGYVAYAVAMLVEGDPFLIGTVAAVVLPAVLIYVVAPVFTLRFLSALVGVGMLVLYVWHTLLLDSLWSKMHVAEITLSYQRLLILNVAALICWRLVVASERFQVLVPLAWAVTALALVAGWWAPALSWSNHLPVTPQWAWVWSLGIMLALLPIYALAAMLKGSGGRVAVGAALMLMVASIGWLGAPGVAVALTWVLVGRLLGRRALLGFSVVALLTYLAQFYYQLETPLLQKAWVLGGTGAWLLFGTLLLTGFGKTKEPKQANAVASGKQSGRWRAAAIVAGLLLVLLIANLSIAQRERLLRQGQDVVLELAPVDPRSLMQGDYMMLRYAVANEVQALLSEPTELADAVRKAGRGWLLLVPDADGVHRLRGVSAEADELNDENPLEQGAQKLAFRLRDGEVWIVTDAWFFPEGQQGHYEQARYGRFRVNAQGSGLLLDLLDGQRQGLKAGAALPEE